MSFKKSATRTELFAATELFASFVQGKSFKQIGEENGRGPTWVKARVDVVWMCIGALSDEIGRRSLKTKCFDDVQDQVMRAVESFREELATLPEDGPLEELKERNKGDLRGLSDRAYGQLWRYLDVRNLASLKKALAEGRVVPEQMNMGPGAYNEILEFVKNA